MANLENNAWVFDSLVGFLHGPVWNVPLQTFIEEKSLPFEPTEDGQVPDKPEYKKIHNEYRNLVDVMLGSFMEDIGITADQFQAACHLSAHDLAGLPAYFHKRLFEQIWAANDYEMFVKMMTHKNVELQLQALELIEKRYGAMPNLYSSEAEETNATKSDSADWPDNDDVMNEITKLQQQESITTENFTEVKVSPDEVVAEKQSLITKLQHLDSTDRDNEKKIESNEVQSSSEWKKPPPKVEITEEELKERQEYLKQQRDKLLALKKQVREKQLGAAASDNVASAEGASSFVPRPKSSHAARAVLKGNAPAPPPDAMQLRRALASKLKAEVVDNMS
ncbi:cilia- and flagella-associated protein 36 [Aricia agestis]|uniref:cilia- and flagella-associated protein 36 n=1 Tax=Aricia agestis TaxID=91739 RepID=UPI001C207B75|nr:cilia- and flagella-associated protein 36 [Aricia agestis]